MCDDPGCLCDLPDVEHCGQPYCTELVDAAAYEANGGTCGRCRSAREFAWLSDAQRGAIAS